MGKPYFEVLDCIAGVDAAAGASGTATAIPTDASGTVPDYCVLVTQDADVKYRVGIGATPIPAAATGVLLPVNEGRVVRTRGYTHIYVYGTSASLNIAAIENS